jgi:anionic cell wall polymer biosynthesis LytR-Cps2A-Psr (LCP) family protein
MVRVILLTVFISGCSSMYKTSHELFIDMMNDYMKMNMTLSEFQSYSGKKIADKEFIDRTDVMVNGDKKIHYSWPNIFGRFCNYYLIVDSGTKIVNRWGFDKDKSDPEKNCWVSG